MASAGQTDDILVSVVVLVVMTGVFIIIPICIAILARGGKIDLNSWLHPGNKCPRCGATRTDAYCAHCGGRVAPNHRGGR